MYSIKLHRESILQVKIEFHRNSESNTAIKYIELLKRFSLCIKEEFKRYLFPIAVVKKSPPTRRLKQHSAFAYTPGARPSSSRDPGLRAELCLVPAPRGDPFTRPFGCESGIAYTLWPPQSSVLTASGDILQSPRVCFLIHSCLSNQLLPSYQDP